MATKSEAPAIAVAPLAVAFLFPSFFVSQKKKFTSAYACRKRIVALNSQISRVAEHALSFCYCASFPPPPPPLINSQFSTVPLYALLDATGPSPLPLKTMCSPLPPPPSPPKIHQPLSQVINSDFLLYETNFLR